jgi:hypothetical protein
MSKYMATIYKCKPVPPTAAEQMMVDTLALKNALLAMARVGQEPDAPPPST